MAITKTVNVETTNARASTTLTDTTPTVPLPDTPQGLMVIGPQVTLHFVEGAWNQANSYDYYDVVQVDGTSYIAVQDVPVGTEITNTEYWAKWNDPNAQLETLQDAINTFTSKIETIDTDIDEINTSIDSLSTSIDGVSDSVSDIADSMDRPMLYGICHHATNTQKWIYVGSSDMKNAGCMGNLPSRSTSYDYSDATSLFEKNGILYYPQDSHNDIYATTDGETWETGYATGYPTPIKSGYKQWAPMLFEDASGEIKLAIARQYNGSTFENAIGSTTYNFRIDVFDCTIGDTGVINIGSSFTTVLDTGSHIDPYIIYNKDYGYIMACKNELTCLIEVYQGASLSSMTLAFATRLVGCEAPKLLSSENSIVLYYEGYNLYTGTGKTAGNAIPIHLYFTHVIAMAGSTLSYGSMSILATPSFYRHMCFVLNSEVLAKYAKNHPLIPYNGNYEQRIVQINLTGDQTDIYPATLPFPLMFAIRGGARTITIHNATNNLLSGCIAYLLCTTDNAVTLTNAYASYTLTENETLPCYVSDTMYIPNNAG